MTIDSSPEKVEDLAHDVGDAVTWIKRLNENLLSSLKSLESTFKDEGINIVKNNVNATEKKLDDAMPDLTKVCNALMAYAQHLKASRNL